MLSRGLRTRMTHNLKFIYSRYYAHNNRRDKLNCSYYSCKNLFGHTLHRMFLFFLFIIMVLLLFLCFLKRGITIILVTMWFFGINLMWRSIFIIFVFLLEWSLRATAIIKICIFLALFVLWFVMLFAWRGGSTWFGFLSVRRIKEIMYIG